MTDQLFAVPDPAYTERPPKCNARGTVTDWLIPRGTRPRCNRPSGHHGEHRVYTRSARMLAEWTHAVAEAGRGGR